MIHALAKAQGRNRRGLPRWLSRHRRIDVLGVQTRFPQQLLRPVDSTQLEFAGGDVRRREHCANEFAVPKDSPEAGVATRLTECEALERETFTIPRDGFGLLAHSRILWSIEPPLGWTQLRDIVQGEARN